MSVSTEEILIRASSSSFSIRCLTRLRSSTRSNRARARSRTWRIGSAGTSEGVTIERSASLASHTDQRPRAPRKRRRRAGSPAHSFHASAAPPPGTWELIGDSVRAADRRTSLPIDNTETARDPLLWLRGDRVALGSFTRDLVEDYWRWEQAPQVIIGYGRQIRNPWKPASQATSPKPAAWPSKPASPSTTSPQTASPALSAPLRCTSTTTYAPPST